MLTTAEVQRALDKAPELRYIDLSWRVHENYVLVKGEFDTYVCASEFRAVENPLGPGPAYKANEFYDVRPEDELRERLIDYFLQKYRGSADEKLNDFLMQFLRRSDDTVDAEGEERFYRWLRKEHENLDEAVVSWLYGLSAEAFDEFDETVAEWLSSLHRQAIKAFRIGGQERLFRRLRKHYGGAVEEQTLERLFAGMRKEFDRGASVDDVLGKVVYKDKVGVTMPGPFTTNVVFNSKQDMFRQSRKDLDEVLKVAKNRPRTFYPLSSPRLFLEFANLGGKEINEEDVLKWVHRHGILGIIVSEYVGDMQIACLGGPKETVAAFIREAKEANWIKRVYEATISIRSTKNEVVKEAIEELRELLDWPTYYQPSPQECEDEALDTIRLGVQSKLDRHCLIRWQRAGNGLLEFLEFKNVLGAMYLQFAWVLREKASVRRCKHCGKPVEGTTDVEETGGRKTYKNKKFCNRKCKDDYNNERKRKRSEEENPSLSVPLAAKKEMETLATARGMDIDVLFQEMLQIYKEHHQTG